MRRLTTALAAALALALCASAHAADEAPAAERGLTDLLGGATWSERRLTITAGVVDLDMDGAGSDQRAVHAAVAGQAISGYRFKDTMPAGGILGLGLSANAWRIRDDVHAWAVAPYAVGIAGVYADINERLRGQLTLNAGPGVSYISGDGDSDVGFGWTWGAEATLAITAGDARGFGIGLGYAEQRLDEFEQRGVYVAITIGL